MQSLVGKIEQLTANPSPHSEMGLKSLKEKTDSLNKIVPYAELMPNQSALIFSEYEDDIGITVAMHDEEQPSAGAMIAIALLQQIEQDPEFLEKVMELFQPDPEE